MVDKKRRVARSKKLSGGTFDYQMIVLVDEPPTNGPANTNKDVWPWVREIRHSIQLSPSCDSSLINMPPRAILHPRAWGKWPNETKTRGGCVFIKCARPKKTELGGAENKNDQIHVSGPLGRCAAAISKKEAAGSAVQLPVFLHTSSPCPFVRWLRTAMLFNCCYT